MKYLNIELTSKCALRCSRCARTQERGQFTPQDLSLETLKKALSPSLLNKLQEVDLSGNYGDPIYHPQFLEIISWFKGFDIPLYIETNGSGKSEEFWQHLSELLGPEDILSFSIDGLEDTNHLYRQGANWPSILTALKTLKNSKGKVFWKFIVFKHNQDQIEEAKELASRLGVKKFKTVHSSLFNIDEGQVDPLMPELKFVAPSLRKKLEGQEKAPDGKKEIHPKCKEKERHYISAEGIYMPCCWAGHLETLKDFSYKDHFNIHDFSLDEILSSQALKDFESLWNQFESAPKVCQNKCSIGCDQKSLNTSHEFSYSKLPQFNGVHYWSD